MLQLFSVRQVLNQGVDVNNHVFCNIAVLLKKYILLYAFANLK